MPVFRWTAFQDLLALQQRMNRILEEAMHPSHFGAEERAPGHWSPVCDMFETNDDVVLTVELPGVARSEVDLEIDGERLTLRGARKMPENASSEAFLRMERTYGPFRRDFRLPSEVEPDRSTAELEDGVLIVRIPKCSASSRIIPVDGPDGRRV